MMSGEIITQIIGFMTIGLLLYAAVIDVKTYTISNKLCAAVFLLYPIAFLASAFIGGGDGEAEIIKSLLWNFSAAIAMFFFGGFLFWAGLFGGGDSKLIAALAMWTGWKGLLPFLVIMSLAGGILTGIILFVRNTSLFNNTEYDWLQKMQEKDRGVPYGVAIAAAGITYIYLGI